MDLEWIWIKLNLPSKPYSILHTFSSVSTFTIKWLLLGIYYSSRILKHFRKLIHFKSNFPSTGSNLKYIKQLVLFGSARAYKHHEVSRFFKDFGAINDDSKTSPDLRNLPQIIRVENRTSIVTSRQHSGNLNIKMDNTILKFLFWIAYILSLEKYSICNILWLHIKMNFFIEALCWEYYSKPKNSVVIQFIRYINFVFKNWEKNLKNIRIWRFFQILTHYNY